MAALKPNLYIIAGPNGVGKTIEGKMKKNHKNMSLGDMAEEALRKAVARVVEEHRKSGEPLAVWRDGKVVR